MMNKFRLLLLASSLFVLNGIGHAQTSTMSLNSSNPKIVWEVKQQEYRGRTNLYPRF